MVELEDETLDGGEATTGGSRHRYHSGRLAAGDRKGSKMAVGDSTADVEPA